jgi:hypothetical protein
LLVWSFVGPVAAQGHEVAQESHETHHEHHNEIAVVLGGTYESEEEKTFFTWGLEYERLFSRRFGISAVGEHITDVDAVVVAAPFVYRPVPALKLMTGPGLELKPRRSGGEHGHEERSHAGEAEAEATGDETLFLWRFGVGYGFHVGGVVVTPAVDLDLVREHGRWVEAVVFDVSIGFGF